MARKLVATVAIVAALIAGGLWAAVPAQAGGGVDITGWCRARYGSQAFHGVLVANNVYGWRCQYGTDAAAQFNVDMNAACAWKYPGHPGDAHFTNYSNPYSWYCS